MGKSYATVIALVGLLLAAGWFLVERALDPDRRPAEVTGTTTDPGTLPGLDEGDAGSGVVGGPAAPAGHDTTPPASAVVGDDVVYTPEDVEIFRATLAWARKSGVDSLPIGEIIARTGQRFVGNDYTPHTLDPPGPERLVVNLREFDCVTFVESTLALARVIQAGDDDFAAFTHQLRRIRYRGGTLDGYTSRLHYFSEWIADNAGLGLVEDVTVRLGGHPDDEPIDFMSSHADAYPSFEGHPERVDAIREVEAALSRRDRSVIPQDEIGAAVDGIRNGDIIAVTSSVEGLDVAHTGFALWRDGRLHLMHAPLVGKALEISDRPLAERILRIDGQDGIVVARPL
jgi:hypothetical protein